MCGRCPYPAEGTLQETKQLFCCRVLSGRLLLASRVGLKAFFYNCTVLTVILGWITGERASFQAQIFEILDLHYAVVMTVTVLWEINLSTYLSIMRILLLIFILHAVIYVHHMTNTVFLKVYLFVKNPNFPQWKSWRGGVYCQFGLSVRVGILCRQRGALFFLFLFFLNVMAGNDNKRAVPYFCKHHLLAGLLF